METLEKLRQVELKTAQDDNTMDSQPKETGCDKLFTQINTVLACSSIIDCISQTLTHSYDLLTILISIADVTTDVWVIYKFYIDKRETFFLIALIIMIVAQLSYAIAFVFRFQPRWSMLHTNTEIRGIVMFCTILPLTPIMSFIFYWCEMNDKNWFIKFLDKMFYIEDELHLDADNIDQPKILLWIKKKARKHMGFILEAMVEAIPQSIIQLIAIVYYQDTEIINVVSICISLLSVATKTMVFSVAIDFKVFIYNWLSLVCDFFGIFAIICWYVFLLYSIQCRMAFLGIRISFLLLFFGVVITMMFRQKKIQNKKQKRVFYNPNEPGTITPLGQVWIYKAIIMWIISCLFVGLPTALYTYTSWVGDICDRFYLERNGCFHLFRKEFMWIALWILLFCVGAAFSIIICEIVGFAPIAAYMYLLEHERHIGYSITSQYAKAAFDFIFQNKSLYQPISINIPVAKKDKSTANDEQNSKVEVEDKDQNIDHDQNHNYNYNYQVTIGKGILLNTNEQLFRLIYINYCWIKFEYFNFCEDSKLIKYLTKELNNEWSNVSLKSLGINCRKSDEFSDLWSLLNRLFRYFPPETNRNFRDAMADNGSYQCQYKSYHIVKFVYVYLMLYVFLPVFILSRLFSIFFPLIAVVYFNFDIESIQLLQWILTGLYAIFMGAWVIAAIKCFYFYHWTIRLFPGLNSWYHSSTTKQQGLNLMQKYYNRRLNDKFIYDQGRKIVIEILGKDIGRLVVSFWPKFEFMEWLKELQQEISKLA